MISLIIVAYVGGSKESRPMRNIPVSTTAHTRCTHASLPRNPESFHFYFGLERANIVKTQFSFQKLISDFYIKCIFVFFEQVSVL